MVPSDGSLVPEIALKSVDLPAPFGPTIPTKPPSAMSSDTPLSAGRLPYATSSELSFSTLAPFRSEISLTYFRVGNHDLRRSRREHRAVVEYYQTIGQTHHCMHRVFDYGDG